MCRRAFIGDGESACDHLATRSSIHSRSHMRSFRLLTLLAGLGVFVVLSAHPSAAPGATSVGHYHDFGDAGGFMNILPPGQDGVLNGPEAIQAQAGVYPPHFKDQLGMYGDLVYNTPG